MCGKSRRPSGAWLRPSPTTRWAFQFEMSLPLKITRPAEGRTRPEMARRVEVLPAPLGPITATISPAATESDIPFTAATLP